MSARSPILDSELTPGSFVPPGTQLANTVYAGPTSGAAALPTFRLLVIADVPGHNFGKGILALDNGESVRSYIGAGVEALLTFGAPLLRDGNNITIRTASASQSGALSSDDWTTFNNKQAFATNLNTLSATDITALGLNLLGLDEPGASSYIRINHLGFIVYMTPAEVRADIGAAASGSNDDITAITNCAAIIAPEDTPLQLAGGAHSGNDGATILIDAASPSGNANISLLPAGNGQVLVTGSRPVDRLPVYTVATLPASPGQGDTAMVTDALNDTFRDTVTGGGGNALPVHFDGSDWRIG